MKNRKGFTLIEMLVVIAVVGILSAALLTALGPARNKGRDARIMSNLNQIAAIAETKFDGNFYPPSADPDIAKLINDTKNYNDNSNVIYNTSGAAFAVYSSLASGGGYCVDSTGARKTYGSSQSFTSSTCP